MNRLNAVKNFFSVEGMLGNKNSPAGKIPATREAYINNFYMAWPAALQGIGLSLSTLADTAMVGGLGAEAIAAVGISHLPIYMFTAVIRSFNIGLTAVLSRRYGENDGDGVVSCFKQGLLLNTLISILLLLFIMKYSENIIVFAGAGMDIAEKANEYYRIVCIGNLFNCMCLTINAAQIGVGNSKISMITNIAANLVNLVLNYFLIYGKGPFPQLGTKGAAIATMIGYIVAFILSVFSVSHKNRLLYLFSWRGWKLKKNILLGIGRVGIPALAENCLMQCGFFIHQRLISGLGTVAIAAQQIGNAIYNISFYFGDGLANACASMVGRQLGAKRSDLAMLYGKVAQRTAFVAAWVFCAVLCLLKNRIPELFTNDTAVLMQMPAIVAIIGVLTVLQTTGLVYAGALRGAGDTAYVAVSSLICITLVRPVMAYLFMYQFGFGLVGGWMGYLVDQTLRVLFGWVRFSRGKWEKIKL